MGELSEIKYKVLIVDDSDTNRAILNEILCGEYIILETDSGGRAAECEFRCRTIWLSSDDRTFSKLTEAVSEGTGQEALEASHTLNGICGNLSIDKLFALFSEQVVLMRADKWDEAYAMMPEISTERGKKKIASERGSRSG